MNNRQHAFAAEISRTAIRQGLSPREAMEVFGHLAGMMVAFEVNRGKPMETVQEFCMEILQESVNAGINTGIKAGLKQ